MKLRVAVVLLGAFLASPCLGLGPWDAVSQVSQSQYASYQHDIQDMGLGHYGGAAYDQGFRNRYNSNGSASESLGFKEANLYIQDQFTAMGLSVTQQSDYKNVIAEIPGRQTPENIYIISGHYDHKEVNVDAPGGDDNASGTAGVLEAARVLSSYQFNCTIRFIAWGGEEGWMLGSWDYVRNVVKPNSDPTHQNIVGVLNLDMILRPGWDSQPTHVKDVDLATRTVKTSCLDWANKFRNAATIYAPSLLINPQTHGSESDPNSWYASDQGPFLREQDGFLYPALMIADNSANEIWSGQCNAYYHTANDASDRLANDPGNPSGITYEYAFATDVVRSAVGLLADEAQIVPEPGSLILLVLGSIILLARLGKS